MSSASENPTVPPTEPRPRLRLIPLDDTVVFPNMGITLTVDVGEDERVVLVPRHENEFLEVGTIAEVSERIRLPGGGRAGRLDDHCRHRSGLPRRAVFGLDDRGALRAAARHGSDLPRHLYGRPDVGHDRRGQVALAGHRYPARDTTGNWPCR